jgi:hypothetical protein
MGERKRFPKRGIRRRPSPASFVRRILYAAGMALFGLVFAVVALMLIGLGFALGLVGIVLTGILTALGVVSSSVALGWRSGRPSVGIRAFFIQVGILAGLPAGAVCAYLAHSFFKAYGEGWPVIVYGAIAGGVAGMIIALSFDYVSRGIQGWVAGRLQARRAARGAALPPAPTAPVTEDPLRPRRSGMLR